MRTVLRGLASKRLTLCGMVLLALGAALSYGNPAAMPVWVLVAPLALLAMNLVAAIPTNPRIYREGGLLLFHLGLLAIVVLAALGRLTHMTARLELAEGEAFAPEALLEKSRGPLHAGRLDALAFVQGPYSVDYAPGMARGPTRSQVLVPDGAGGWERRIVGDDTPLVLEGYRFYTSFNKGYAPVLTWAPDNGAPLTGAVNMPSYPLFDYRQANRWTPPGGEEIMFWLQLRSGLEPQAAWTLDPAHTRAILVVNAAGRRVELQPGAEVRLAGGILRYERLSGWMGYKLFYDPTLPWLFAAALLAVLGLAAYLWRRLGAGALAQRNADPVRAARIARGDALR